MHRISLFLLLFIAVHAYAQNDSVIRYANGQPQYVLTYRDNVLKKNIYLSPTGDTIYKWDIGQAIITEYPVTGDYLLHKEYEPRKIKMPGVNSVENAPQINATMLIPPSSREWGAMHSIFFQKCKNYTQVLREGDFTIVIAYKNSAKTGSFQKFYQGRLVVSGQYLNGKRSGVWMYYPYHFYPYYDATFFDRSRREWSFIYSILPAVLAFIALIITGRYFRQEKYQYFFYAVIACAVATLLLRLCIPFDRENVWIRFVIPALWFVFWQAMTILAVVNLFFSGRRTNTHPLINVFCLLIGFSFSIFVLFLKHLNF